MMTGPVLDPAELAPLLRDYQPDLPARLIRRLASRWFYVRFGLLGRRYGRLVREEIDGVPFIVLPEVFNPVLLRTGQLLAEAVAALPAAGWPGLAVLDMGTGSGVGAIFAARRGARVTAVDINPAAVRCARLNVLLNRLEAQVEVCQGDLFEPVAGRRFDLVLFNPPFYRGVPASPQDAAWRGLDVFERFSAGLGQVLEPGGQALLVLSTDGDCARLLRLLHRAGFKLAVMTRHNLVSEIITVYKVS